MDLNRVRDMVDPSTERVYAPALIELEMQEKLVTDGPYVVTCEGVDLMGFRQYDRISFTRMIEDWRSFSRDAGQAIRHAIGAPTSDSVYHRYSEQSLAMMQGMGWTPGTGLGRDSQGRTSPIPTPNPRGGGGLGGPPARGARPDPGGGRAGKGLELKAHELDTGKIVYGRLGNRDGAEVLEVWDVTPRGKAFPTGEVVHLVREWGVRAHELRDALMWDGGPVGVAEVCYPHPKGWMLKGAKEGSTLEGMTVRVLTALLRKPFESEPSCFEAWIKALGPCDPQAIAARVCSPLLTPRDFKSWYRIFNRNLYTRNISRGPHSACRLCNKHVERFSLVASCSIMQETFSPLAMFSGRYHLATQTSDRFIYLGLVGETILPSALSAMHIILWKFVMIAYTRCDVKGEPFKPARIWKDAVRRFRARLMARCEVIRRSTIRHVGNLPPKVRESHEQILAPCATVSEDGVVTWTPPLRELLTSLKLEAMPTSPWQRIRSKPRRRKRARLKPACPPIELAPPY